MTIEAHAGTINLAVSHKKKALPFFQLPALRFRYVDDEKTCIRF